MTLGLKLIHKSFNVFPSLVPYSFPTTSLTIQNLKLLELYKNNLSSKPFSFIFKFFKSLFELPFFYCYILCTGDKRIIKFKALSFVYKLMAVFDIWLFDNGSGIYSIIWASACSVAWCYLSLFYVEAILLKFVTISKYLKTFLNCSYDML